MKGEGNKLIVILNYSSNLVGGAPIRYLFLFAAKLQYLSDYYLIINSGLYLKLTDLNIEINENKIIITKEAKVLLDKIRLGPFKTFLNGLLRWLKFSWTFITVLRKYKIGIVFGVYTGGIFASFWKRILGFRFVYSFNDSSYSSLSRDFFKIFQSERYPVKYADKIDFLSHGLISGLEQIVGNIEQIKICISPNSFIAFPERFFPSKKKTIDIIFASRLTAYKNPLLFLKALVILKERDTCFKERKFALLGDGPLLEECRRFKESKGLLNVEIPGSVNNVQEYLNKCRIFVSIQNTNNYPSQSLMEAMLAGNAIIASNVGETFRIITENEGILISIDEIELFAAMEALLNNREMTVRFGENARRKILYENNIERYLSYFEELLCVDL